MRLDQNCCPSEKAEGRRPHLLAPEQRLGELWQKQQWLLPGDDRERERNMRRVPNDTVRRFDDLYIFKSTRTI